MQTDKPRKKNIQTSGSVTGEEELLAASLMSLVDEVSTPTSDPHMKEVKRRNKRTWNRVVKKLLV